MLEGMSDDGAAIIVDAIIQGTDAQFNVLRAVLVERAYQDAKHGSIEEHGHTLGEWLLIAEAELAEAKNALIKGGTGRDSVKSELIQVVATLFACLEQHGLDPVEKRAV